MVMSKLEHISKVSEAKAAEIGEEIVLRSTCVDKQSQLAKYQVSRVYSECLSRLKDIKDTLRFKILTFLLVFSFKVWIAWLFTN